MEDLIDKNIAKRIKALLAKSRGTDNEAEAALFAQKAAEMLQEHNLTEARLGGDDATEPMIERIFHSVDWNPWRTDIVWELCQLYFSQAYFTRDIHQGKLRRAVMLVGRPHNLDVVQSMQEYLVTTTQRLAKEYSRDRKTVLQFEKGCGTRLAMRIAAMSAKARTPAPQVAHQPNAGNLPALYKTELQLADDIVKRATGGRMARDSGHRGGGSAVAAGYRAGDRVNLGGQIGQRAGAHLLGSR